MVGGVACMCFLEMGRWAKRFLSFSRLLHFLVGRDRMSSHDFCWGRWGGKGVGPLFELLTFLQVFVGFVEEFEEVRGFSYSKSSHSCVILVWVILARQLSVVHFNLHFRCTQSKPKNF